MALGGTAKKLQKVANAAEDLYGKMNEVIGQLKELREEVEHTSTQVDQLEHDVAKQGAILEALAEAEGMDVEQVVDAADIPPAPDEESGEAPEAAADGGDASADG